MNQLLKFAAYGIAGVALLIGSFVTFSVLTGTPMHEMKGVGGMFPENVTAESLEPGETDELPAPDEERRNDVRSPRQVYESSATPLSAFALNDPYSSGELEALEKSLKMSLEELTRRSNELDERERLVDEEMRHAEDLYAELAVLRTQLLDQYAETEAAGEEVARGAQVVDQRQKQIYREMAILFEDTDADAAAKLLMNMYEPDEAAQVLLQLDDDRTRELIGEMGDRSVEYMRALQNAKMDETPGE